MKRHSLPVQLHAPAPTAQGTLGYPSPHSHALISAVEAAPVPSAYPVQMRLPNEASTTSSQVSDAAMGRDLYMGVRRLNARIYYRELSDAQRLQVRQILTDADVTLADWHDMSPPDPGVEDPYYIHVNNAMTAAIAQVAPEKIASDQERVGRPAADSADFADYDALMKLVFGTIEAMLHTPKAFDEVFGGGAAEAMGRLDYAFREFQKLLEHDGVHWDMSGAMEEMMVGGHSTHHQPIVLKVVGGAPYTASDAQVATIIHEMMHFACDDIFDAGGYPGQAEFSTQSVAVKLLNAAHYEEVAHRILGSGAVGGVFTPAESVVADASGAPVVVDSRTPAERSLQAFKARIRTAWIFAQNMRNYLQHISTGGFEAAQADAGQNAALRSANQFFQLGIPDDGHVLAGAPTQTDVLQVESITKSLAQMMQVDLSAAFPVDAFVDDATSFAAARELLAGEFADPIWMTADTWTAMLPVMEVAPQDARAFRG